MPSGSPHAGVRRLTVAAGISLLLHAALVLTVSRSPGNDSPLAQPPVAAPLAARLVTAMAESVRLVDAPADAADRPAPTPASAVADAVAPPSPVSGETYYYFKASELDRRPFPLARIEVPPPESADAVSGSVMIRLRISESGRVDDARIVMGTGIREFEAAALREFSTARFHPGYRGRLPVRSEMLIEVTLRPPPQPAKPQQAAVDGDSN